MMLKYENFPMSRLLQTMICRNNLSIWFVSSTGGNCSILNLASMKLKRVARSILVAELYALFHAYDAVFFICHTMSTLLGTMLNLPIFTDSRTLFDLVVSLCSMAEKRVLIDISGLSRAYNNMSFLGLLGFKRSLISQMHWSKTSAKVPCSKHCVQIWSELHLISRWLTDRYCPEKISL